jgi:hypothetical protein
MIQLFPATNVNPGSGCSALKGYNRMHAILGRFRKVDCSSSRGDMCIALLALMQELYETTTRVKEGFSFRISPLAGYNSSN